VDGVEQAVAESDFLYLRCNATSWNLDDQSRLAPLGYSDLALTYNVSADWMRTGGDTCSFMTTNAKNGWGSQQKYYDTTFSGVGQPSTLGAEATSQKDFSVRYPVLGRYQATVRKYDDSLKIALAMLPARQQAVIGTPVTFGVEATGADLTYRWQTKYENEPESAWTDVPGATAPNAQITTGGASMFCQQVRAVVSTPSGVIESVRPAREPAAATSVLARPAHAAHGARRFVGDAHGVRRAGFILRMETQWLQRRRRLLQREHVQDARAHARG
jgi:hypothetical protein